MITFLKRQFWKLIEWWAKKKQRDLDSDDKGSAGSIGQIPEEEPTGFYGDGPRPDSTLP